MADIYVRSTDGSDSNSGATRALAKATTAGAIAASSAGTRVLLGAAHAESVSAATTWTFPGTAVSPNAWWSAAWDAEPPTALAAGASVTVTGAYVLTINGNIDARGINLSTANFSLLICSANGNVQEWLNCGFHIVSTSSSGYLGFGNSATSLALRDCTFRFSNDGQRLAHNGGTLAIIGGSVDGAGSTPVTNGLIYIGTRPVGTTVVAGLNMSACATTLNLVRGSYSGLVQFVGCPLPIGWTGALITSTRVAGLRVEMYACDAGASVLRDQVADFAGDLYTETTVLPTGVAKSWRIVKTTNALAFNALPIKFPLTAGTHTIGIDVLTDGVTLTDADAWLEVQYASSASTTLYTTASDAASNPFATAAQDSSSTTWTTTGLSSPVAQRLSVTVTVGQDCIAVATVRVARPSATVYVSPVPILS